MGSDWGDEHPQQRYQGSHQGTRGPMAAKLGVLKGQTADLDRVLNSLFSFWPKKREIIKSQPEFLCTVQPSFGHQWSHQGSKLLLSQLSPGGDHLKFCEESCGPVAG